MQKPEEENLNDLLKTKFFSPSRFSEEIEKVVLENPSMDRDWETNSLT